MKCCHLKNLLPKLLCLIKSKQAKKQGFFEARINSPHCWQLVWWSDFTLWCFFLFKKLRSHIWLDICYVIFDITFGGEVGDFLGARYFFLTNKQGRYFFSVEKRCKRFLGGDYLLQVFLFTLVRSRKALRWEFWNK